MNQPDTARFIYGGKTYTRDEMLADHEDDDNFCDWLCTARPGDVFGGSLVFGGICACVDARSDGEQMDAFHEVQDQMDPPPVLWKWAVGIPVVLAVFVVPLFLWKCAP